MSTKTKKRISWGLSGLLAFVFLVAGVTKLAGAAYQLAFLQSWGYPLWLRFPIGLAELALAAGLLWPAYRTLTLYAVFGWAVAAAFTHLQAGQGAALLSNPMSPVFLAGLALLDLLVWRSAHRPVANPRLV